MNGDAIVNVLGETFTAGKYGCPYALGRNNEADALADPLLVQYGQGTPAEQLTRKQVGKRHVVLKAMGQYDQAKPFENELIRRARRKLGLAR